MVTFKKSSFCADASCVEVARDPVLGYLYVRHSKDEKTLVFLPQEWRDFVRGVKAGEFDDEQV